MPSTPQPRHYRPQRDAPGEKRPALKRTSPVSTVGVEPWRVRSAAAALRVPRTAIQSLLTINRADRVTIINAAAKLAEEAMR